MTNYACSPAPYVVTPTTGGSGPVLSAVFSTKVWPIASDKLVFTYFFLGGTANQQSAVTSTIATWTKYANVGFDVTSQNTAAKPATFRISFIAGQGSWSTVGTDAQTVDFSKATMNLGWLADASPPSAENQATILHEFGHALGMMHEHQSPARGERIHLKELAVYNFYRPLLGNNDALVKSQIIDQYNLSTISNYSHLDLTSIMMYFMPGYLNEEGIDIPVNLTLSALDQAFMVLNYPGNSTTLSPTTALITAGVSNDVSSTILYYIQNKKYDLARSAFSQYNMNVMQLHSVNKSFLSDVNPTSVAQFGILDTISSIVQDPLFKGIIKNIVNQVFVQRAIPAVTGVPGSAQKDVRDTIGAIITHPVFAQAVFDMNTKFAVYSTAAATTSAS